MLWNNRPVSVSLAVMAISASLSGCAVSYASFEHPTRPSARLLARSNLQVVAPTIDAKGCYQQQAIIPSGPNDPEVSVPADVPLVVGITGATGLMGMLRCDDLVRFQPQPNRQYGVYSRVGRDPNVPQAERRSIMGELITANTENNCHIAVVDETDGQLPEPVAVKHVNPRTRGLRCIRFE